MIAAAEFVNETDAMRGSSQADYRLTESFEILLTSERGDRLASTENATFSDGQAEGVVIHVYPDKTRQTLHGIGTSFTESSAFVLAHLDTQERQQVVERIYSERGANFSLARTVIGATDFSVEGRFSYDDIEGDTALEHFSVAADSDGFSRDRYPGIRDTKYDLLPMIKQALAIKERQKDPELNIIASAWTAPAWMKDIDDWYQPGNAGNNFQGTGGRLKRGYEACYAGYLVKYLDQYSEQGIKIWGITPVNEPFGNNGQWESMHFSAETQNEFIKHHLGPALQDGGHTDVKLLVYDHNRGEMEEFVKHLYSDGDTARYIHGAAVHWYGSTNKVYEDVFERVHSAFPRFDIIHTEGTIDDLGNDAPPGVTDPARYKESGWFNNDKFWWNENATDWAYSATWEGVSAEDHPIYAPVHRYARDIIVGLNHWVSGWIDWNIVLDRRGGPNHAGNYCGAPIMIDTDTGHIYYTPVFYVLSQFSRTIRPGDKAVKVNCNTDSLDRDAIHACASVNDDKLLSVQVLNTSKETVDYKLQIGRQYAAITLEANALQTVRVQL